MRIAIDAMGGDHAPEAIVRGAVESLDLLDGGQLVLIGDERRIRQELAKFDGWAERISIEPASQVIGMDEEPVVAVRQKRDSSITRMAALAAERRVDAIISAGNTGACAAACQLKIKPLPGVLRPGIAVVIPSFGGPTVLCDVGANIAAKPKHLYQYAIMSSVYARQVLGVSNPRVGLLSIGEEDVKGTKLVKEARELLRADARINLVGNVEGRDLLHGRCDVVVCDGFGGNIVLKLTEGLAEGLFDAILRQVTQENPGLASAFEPVLRKVRAQHDYSEYGGAPLLGIDGVCIICHGRSDHRAIRNAVRVASEFVSHELNAEIVELLSQEKAGIAQ